MVIQMNEPLFFDPVFHEKIWGGSKIKNYFPSEEASDGPIGEAWIISAHPHGVTRVMNGPYTGIGLDELWETHKELFGDLKSDRFPLLIKIINAEDDLAVQVHPNDKYALKNENDL